MENKKFTKKESKSLIKQTNELIQALTDKSPLNKEILEAKLLRLNVELAKMNIEEYPKTKKRAKVAYIIAISLAVLQVFQLLWIVLKHYGIIQGK